MATQQAETPSTPAFNRLNPRQQAFFLSYVETHDHLEAARVANYPVRRASVLVKSPRIRAALAERQPSTVVHAQPEPSDVVRMLLAEAQRPENTGAARVQALAKLANIMGIDGGGGTREDGALASFLRGIANSVAQGAFVGVQAGVAANTPGVPAVVAVSPLEPSQLPALVETPPVSAVARVLPAPLPLLDNPLPF